MEFSKEGKIRLITLFLLIFGAICYQEVSHGLGEVFIGLGILYVSGFLEKGWNLIEERFGALPSE